VLLQFHDRTELIGLMKTLRYVASSGFGGTDRADVVISGKRTHVPHNTDDDTALEDSAKNEAFIGVSVTENEYRQEPLMLGTKKDGACRQVAHDREQVWNEDEIVEPGFHIEPLELELDSTGIALVAGQ